MVPVTKQNLKTEGFGPMDLKMAEKFLLQLLESTQQLDIMLEREEDHQDIVWTDSMTLRNKIEELCIQLIFLNPRLHGQEAEDLLWKRVYDDVYHLWTIHSTLMDNCGPEGSYQSHLNKGIDVYHQIFFFVQTVFQLNLESYIDWNPSAPVSYTGKTETSPSMEEMDWARKFCHRCLLCIGNLYHFQREFMDSDAEKQAKKYYYKALTLIPEMGLPFIYLANLSGSKYFYIEATYFNQCCIYSEIPDAKASSNLEEIYEKTKEMYLCGRSARGHNGLSGESGGMRTKVQYSSQATNSLATLDKNNLTTLPSSPHKMRNWRRKGQTPPQYPHQGKYCGVPKNQVNGYISDDNNLHWTGNVLGNPSPNEKRGKDIKRLLVSFLYLQSLLRPNGRKDLRLERLCVTLLEDFDLCLSYLPTKDGQTWDSTLGAEQLDFLPEEVVFQMVILCLLAVHNLRGANLEGEKTVTNFTLALFSRIVHHVSKHIQAELQNKANPEEERTQKPGQPLLKDRELEADHPLYHKGLDQKNRLAESNRNLHSSTLHCRHADCHDHCVPNEVSDLDVNCNSYTILNDNDDWGNISFSSYPDLDGSSKELPSKAKDEERAASEMKVFSSQVLPHIQPLKEKLDAFSAEGLLPTIKVILQWLHTDPGLTTLSMHTFPSLWSDLLVLLNLIPTAEELKNPNLGLSPQLQKLLPCFEQPHSPISMPLQEDVILHNLLPLRAMSNSIDFALEEPPSLSREEAALRACILRTFGHFAAQLPKSLIMFDSRLGHFIKTMQEPKTLLKHTQEERAQRFTKDKMLQQQLLKELELMERNLQLLQARTELSPYLIVDCLALCQYLSLLREMSRSGRFIVIVPRIVIDELDSLKKEKPSARHVFRFLEEELKNKNIYLKCQVEVRQKSMTSHHHPHTGVYSPDSSLCGILQSYEDLVDLPWAETDGVKGLVTMLTALNLANPRTLSYPLKMAFSTAQNVGIEIRHVMTFYRQWKEFS